MIGWVADLTTANAYYAYRMGLIAPWTALSDAEKTAALTTAYNRLSHSSKLSIPTSPTIAQLATLAYAQEEYAGLLIALGEGGVHREAAISQGITSAGIVQESYLKAGEISPIPLQILDILDEFKTEKSFLAYDLYRDEENNPAFKNAFPPLL